MTAKMAGWLPLPVTDGSVKLQLLDGGSFIANYTVLHAGVDDEAFRMYNWAFHIFHPETGRHVLWDLGLTSVRTSFSQTSKMHAQSLTLHVQDPNDYSSWVDRIMLKVLSPVSPRYSIPQQLQQTGIGPEQVDAVVFR